MYAKLFVYLIIWMGAPILWTTKKHQHVGESSSEDEFMALNHAYKAVKWIRNLFLEIGLAHRYCIIVQSGRTGTSCGTLGQPDYASIAFWHNHTV